MLCMICILLKLLRFALWNRMWSILVYVPWAFKILCSLLFLGRVFHRCQLCPVGWQCCSSLLIYCLGVLSMVNREVLKFSTIIVYLPISLFSSISFSFTYFILCCLMYTLVFWIYWSCYHYFFLFLVIFFASKSTLLNTNVATLALFSRVFAWYIFFCILLFSTFLYHYIWYRILNINDW